MQIMRTLMIFLLLPILLIACNSSNDTSTDSEETIVFSARPVKTQSLYAKPTLKAVLKDQQLRLTLELEKLTDKKIIVKEIVLNNPGGLNSFPNNVQLKRLPVINDKDTTLVLTFNHINNNKLFQATGLPGMIDSVYHLSVVFSLEGIEGVRTMNLDFKMPEELFLAYKKKYNTQVQVYNLNAAKGFDERQRQYLLKEKITPNSPFVHMSEQELALSGLNFRFKCFHKDDSLHAEIFVVNHSDLTIRLDTTKLNLIVNNAPDSITKLISINKVTGSLHDKDILRKGDRVICTLRKHVPESPEKIQLASADCFFLSSGKKFFIEPLELVKAK